MSLLCRWLGHVRWQRDGRFADSLMLVPRYEWATEPFCGGYTALGDPVGPSANLRHRFLDRDWGRVEAQQYHEFSRQWRCWRCHDWIWEGPPDRELNNHGPMFEAAMKAEALRRGKLVLSPGQKITLPIEYLPGAAARHPERPA